MIYYIYFAKNVITNSKTKSHHLSQYRSSVFALFLKILYLRVDHIVVRAVETLKSRVPLLSLVVLKLPLQLFKAPRLILVKFSQLLVSRPRRIGLDRFVNLAPLLLGT